MFRLQRCKCSLMHTFYEFWCQKRDVIFLTLYEGTPFYLELCFHNIKLAIESTVGFYSQSTYELVICLRLIYLVPKWISSWTTQNFFLEENETEIRFLKFWNDRNFFSRLIFFCVSVVERFFLFTNEKLDFLQYHISASSKSFNEIVFTYILIGSTNSLQKFW